VKGVEEILRMIKHEVQVSEPEATVILYGSYARGDNKPDSDLDLLILLDKDKVTREDEVKIKYPLYDIEIETGLIISPFLVTKHDWITRHKITPFYENVVSEGIVL